MNRKLYMISFLVALYSLGYFVLSSAVYYISLSQGFNGLGIPIFGGGDDGEFYYQEALNIAAGRPAILTSIHAFILGWILKIFQSDEVFILRTFNFLGSLLTLFVGLKILTLLQLDKRNLSAGLIFVLFLGYYPSFLINSNLSIIRDTWIVFYYLLSILLLLNVLRSRNVITKLLNFVLLLLTLYMLMGYRKYALLCFLAASILYLLFIYRKPSVKSIISLFSFVIIGFSVIYTFMRTFKFPIVNSSIQDILSYRANGIDQFGGGSQMYISLDQSNVINFYLNYFYSVISNAFGPFPWQFTGMTSIILFFSESVLFLFIVYKIFKMKNSLNKYDYFLIINSVVWFMLIGIFNDNIGTAARLRMVGWVPLFLIFAKVCGEQLEMKKALKGRL